MAEKTSIFRVKPPHYEKKVVKPKKVKTENRLLEHIEYCFNVTSLHGLKQIIWPNRSPIERLFWICAVLGLATFGILNSYDIFEHYFERPCVISVDLDYRDFINEFPSFTLCQKGLDEAFLASHKIAKDSEMYEYLHDLAFGNYSSYYLYEKYANGSKKEFLKPDEYLDTLFEAVPTIRNNSNSMNKNNVFPFNVEKPIPKIATELGICSTLNPSNGIYFSSEYFNSSGPYQQEPIHYDHQFTMLKFELRNNVSLAYKVALHSPHEIIDIVTYMYNFRPTTVTVFTATTLSVWTPESVEELSFRQRNCRLFNEADDLDHSPVYTYNVCKIECRIQLCLKYCNCTPYYYRRNSKEKICDMAGMYCLSKHADELINLYNITENKSTCNCYQTCNLDIVVIEKVISTSWFKDTRMTIQVLDHPDLKYVRKLVFTKLDLLLQIGGILGLCLGCTILGIIEVVYFMTLRFYWGVIRGKAIKSTV